MALLALGLTACFPPPAGTPASFGTDPPLFPAFRTDVSNYVIRCDPNTPVAVHVTSPTNTLVSVNGTTSRGGIYGVYVDQQAGERFTVSVNDPSTGTKTYSVRCLPQDFPQWSAQPSQYGVTPYFMTAPLVGGVNAYHAIFDRWGVPLWWSDPQNTIYSTLLPDGNVGTMLNGGVEERKLDGTFVRQVNTVGGSADAHDVVLLPNGHFVMVTSQARTGVDLTALGGPDDASICDHVVQEINPDDGSVVWSWDTADHIPVTEMDPQWFAQYIDAGPTGPCGYDVYHWNSIDAVPGGFLLSFRHLDAIYDIDQASGNISWKLGGSTRPESLTVVGDPVFDGGSHLGGQHDARRMSDGSVTLYDDGTGLGRAPRAVRYAIDTTAHTATLVESATDPNVTSTFCCGSAREVYPGVWVMGWGGSATGTGSETIGSLRQLTLTFPGAIIYRNVPLTSSQVSRSQLDQAMDTRFANPSASANSAGTPDQTSFPP